MGTEESRSSLGLSPSISETERLLILQEAITQPAPHSMAENAHRSSSESMLTERMAEDQKGNCIPLQPSERMSLGLNQNLSRWSHTPTTRGNIPARQVATQLSRNHRSPLLIGANPANRIEYMGLALYFVAGHCATSLGLQDTALQTVIPWGT